MAKKSPQHGRPAGDWGDVFLKAGVRTEELARSMSSRATAIRIGQFFAPLVGREVPIQVNGRAAKAVLRVQNGRANEKRYYFQVSWDIMTGSLQQAAVAPTTKITREKSKGQSKKRSAEGQVRAKAERTKDRPKTKGNNMEW